MTDLSKATPEYKIFHAPEGWGNAIVLYRNESVLLNDRIAPDEEAMIFVKDRLQERERLLSENLQLRKENEELKHEKANKNFQVAFSDEVGRLRKERDELREVLAEALQDSIQRCKDLGLNPDGYSTVYKAKALLSRTTKPQE